MTKKQIWLLSLSLLLLLGTTVILLNWFFGRDQNMNQSPKGVNKKSKQEWVRLYQSKEDRVIVLPLETYIEGVVAAEMPAHFHLEALKAQSLAARTYIIKRKAEGSRLDPKIWGPNAKSAEVSDTIQHQVFLPEEALRKKWGNDYEWRIHRIRQAVSATAGKVIVYQGNPIYAAFFSTSNGWTENSEDYYQTKYPYLRSVSSEWDRESPKYLDQKRFTMRQVVQQLEKKTGKPISLEAGKPSTWIQILRRTDGKRVAEVRIGDQIFTGRQVREALQLSSSDFRIQIDDHSVEFQTKGYGHGVGMSQWGANLLAQRGKKVEEIIRHYYQNVKIVQWDKNSS